MDSNGNFYANEEARKRIESMFSGRTEEKVKPIEQSPPDAIDVDEGAAVELAGMNRRQRMVFYSERAHGKSVEDALLAARDSLPER